MPAAIASNGSADLFASHREPAWHGLGTVFENPVTDYREMLTLSGLGDWDIHTREIAALAADGTVDDIDWSVSANAIVATIGGSDRVLGLTGDRYEIIQNEDAFSFLQSLHDGAYWETAGAISGGRVVFGSLAFDRDFVLDPSGVADVIKSFLLVRTSHDGSTGLGGGVTPVRVVCKNTLNAALSGGIKQSFKIRHTANAEDRMRAEAVAWRTANVYMDAFESEAQALMAKKVSDDQFFGLVETLCPKPDEDVRGSAKKWESRVDLFAQAWKGTPNAGIRGTGWGAWNALTEANQWGRKTQNTNSGAENFAAAGAGFDALTNKFRSDTMAMVRAL